MILIKTPCRGCSRNKQKGTDDERMIRLPKKIREHRMGQSKKDNLEYTMRQKHIKRTNTIFVGHHYAQANTNNVNKL
jgi:hypothetical protein